MKTVERKGGRKEKNRVADEEGKVEGGGEERERERVRKGKQESARHMRCFSEQNKETSLLKNNQVGKFD